MLQVTCDGTTHQLAVATPATVNGKNHPFPGKISHFLGSFLRSSCLHLGYDGQAPPSGL